VACIIILISVPVDVAATSSHFACCAESKHMC
jgi:hypothetical protein